MKNRSETGAEFERTGSKNSFKVADLTNEEKLREISAALGKYIHSRQFPKSPHFDVEDIIQDTVAQALRKQNQIQNTENIFPWLCTIATNYYLTAIKQKRNRPYEQLSYLENMSVNNNEEASLIRKLSKKQSLDIILKQILPSLSPEDISLWVMRYIENLSPEEVGEKIGKSPGAVRVKATRINSAIRNHFAQKPNTNYERKG